MLKQYEILVQDVLEDIFDITRSEDDKLNEIIKKYFLNGGKRVRVLLLLMCAKLGNFELNKKDIIRMASIVEIIHTASLIHDDIIDNAEIRRGSVTMNKLHGDEFALRVGDYLFAVVLREVARFDDERVHYYLADTLKELCIGELIQEDGLYNINTRRLDYLKKIKRKTAILIAFACVAGSIVSKASDENIKSAFSYGYYLGMSYQIIDDYLDFAGGAENLGKEVGQDLMNGNITLPALLAKEKNSELFSDFTRDTTDEEKEEIINFIKNDEEILMNTLNISRRYLEKAQISIENLNPNVKSELTFIMNKLARREN
ncbi:polyprenyl synthetase family protein [uncultured Gemella sp.]|uniref:polyprenyl synthetase family protein n=1 Tax=uncultured Gemella sp. TaxID=254352 RepID=UPI0028D14F59|nr:polyprenyl synthetase family protein [uncultured Gemella sp.]